MLSFGSPTRGANLDRPQQLHLFDPKPYETKTPPKPMAEGQPFFEPPSHVVVWDFHPSGTCVILAQQPTNIPDVSPRPSFYKHRKGKHPKYEAMMLSSYLLEKSEAGKVGFKGKGILV